MRLKGSNLSCVTKIVTHAGVFHADEVCCVALLRNMGVCAPVERVFKLTEAHTGEGILTLDMMGADYDHHMKRSECPSYEDGTHYASLGLLCRDLELDCGGEFLSVVKAIDNADNGEGDSRPAITEVISSFNPTWDEDGSPRERDRAFECAVGIAQQMLDRAIISSKAKAEAEKVAREALLRSSGTVVELEKFVPWEDVITASTGKQIVVFQSLRGDWNARLVPVAPGSRETTTHFPREWWGAAEEDLPEGVTFCHPTGFLVAANSREALLSAIEHIN